MLLMAFETSAKAASVALFCENGLLASQYQNNGVTHSQTLLVMASQILENCGLAPRDVTHLAVANGPGSFTGVRIGAAAAKGFAWGGERPLYGVSTLEAMALGAGIRDGVICCCMDARRAQVYNALFEAKDGQLTRISEDRAIALQDLLPELQMLQKTVFLVGDGANLCYNTLSTQVPNLILLPEHHRQQRAEGVGLAALARIAAGEPGCAGSLTPNYLRLSQAERERLEKEKLEKLWQMFTYLIIL